jgi:ADP-ribose pyrophosphatase YjhB (NUDIX family)/uncharacterized protein YggU (UPF0235/DUF167 family)
MVRAPQTKTAFHAVLAVVLQVRDGRLAVLLWQRAREPFAGSWALPGGTVNADESLEQSIRRQLAAKVDVRELSHLEQLETRGQPDRHPLRREIATAYLGLIRSSANPALPPDTGWHLVDRLPRLAYDHEPIVHAARERLRAKLCYTNIGYALASETFTIADLRRLYAAALGHDVTATNLRRVLLRRGLLEATGEQRDPGREGGRPAALFRFHSHTLSITDQFAVLRPPRDADRPRRRAKLETDDPESSNARRPRNLRRVPGVARFQLRVSPRAAHSAVIGRHGSGWKVRVAAAPEDGRANDALVRLLAAALAVAEGSISIVSGQRSRDKTVEVAGIEPEEAERRLVAAAARHGRAAPTVGG